VRTSRALDQVADWPANAAAGVVRAESTNGSTGNTTSVIDVVGDPTQSFPWASVSKLAVSLAVLVATEEGTIGLDDPAGPPGSTVAHLLAHASGLGPHGTVPLAPPGRRRIYSNAGFEVLADELARRAGMGFVAYQREAVLEPLAMASTSIAEGTSPAWGLSGSLSDLLALCAELLAPTLVSATTLQNATSVAFPGLAGVLPGFGPFDPCDWGLGFELRDAKVPHWTGAANSARTFGHFGRSGAFVWVDPAAEIGCAAAADTPFGPWAQRAWPALADAVVAQWSRTPV
jgi:CubicO group peptidase (beta-lactamase class C family)